MMSDGGLVDGSWELNVLVTDLEVEKCLRVKGDIHIGGVMLKLVESLDVAVDWSDHALWWPERNMWLARTRSTLDQYGVQADAKLFFTPMHKNLRVQLPDLQILDLRVDFSINVFNAVVQICKEIGIRHPEELSVLRKCAKGNDTNKSSGNKPGSSKKKRDSHELNGSNPYLTITSNHSADSIGPQSSPFMKRFPASSPSRSPQNTMLRAPHSPYTPSAPYSPYNGMVSPGSTGSLSFEGGFEATLANSPVTPSREAFFHLHKPKSLSEKAWSNSGWLDSSRSLMEQRIRDNDMVVLKFKLYAFYDLNPKYDSVRINQIYEQAKWSLISEEIDCTDEEMMMFGALQLQAQLNCEHGLDHMDNCNQNNGDGDDVDAALADLQITLEGSHASSPSGDIMKIPELQDYMRFCKPKKIGFKTYKKLWFVFKDTHIAMFKSRDDTLGAPSNRINLKGCEVNPDVNISSQKYGIKLLVPSSDTFSEVWVRCDTEDQYARWMSACKLASKGKTMADSTYETEVKNILAFLSMQHPAPSPTVQVTGRQPDIEPENFVAPKFMKKFKTKSLKTRILENHANVQNMTLTEAKMNYIKAWQALPEFGISYFIVKFRGAKKEEILGIASNRMMRLDSGSGDTIKTWRFSSMIEWNVNWEIKEVQVVFEEGHVALTSSSADSKIIHEYIGGYIFLSMRSGDKNQNLDEEMFHKLTGGWS